eukprot:CAMPEP_0168586580 /NCGR_PEP_ID=MMETSP0420-20121227/4365_1 /TAXON_ID=498008 /ORGANISM="Pessonella sp." /LENGTH=394 /DNA_ID=CAMNT_0008621691 /DNA_START=69 /DNA_END=1250 /DNA_ORIENTATION=-
MRIKELTHEACQLAHHCPERVSTQSDQKCVNGMAGEYECDSIDLLSFTPLLALGSKGDASDIWGWFDEQENKEYAIINAEDGTSFVDVTNPYSPTVLGFLPTQTENSLWHDVKVFKHYAYIVSEAKDHGLQVFDLHRLRSLSTGTDRFNSDVSAVHQLQPDYHYNLFGSAHNIFINEETAVAYVVGQYAAQAQYRCNKVIHAVDLSNPLQPTFAGCVGEQDFDYCHDVQVVRYSGPDTRFVGREIAFGFMGDSFGIMDVTDKNNVETLYKGIYDDLEFCHQGWLFANQSRVIFNDEIDEMESLSSAHTRSIIYDVSKLDEPKLMRFFRSEKQAVDHNNYVFTRPGVQAEFISQSNYAAGLRILKVTDAAQGAVEEVASLDVAPLYDGAVFHGTW